MGKCAALSSSVTQSGRGVGLFSRAEKTCVPKGRIHDEMPPSSQAPAHFGLPTRSREAASVSRKNQELLEAPDLPLISCVTQRK